MVEIRTFAKFSIICFATMIALVDIGVLIFNCLTFSHWFSHLYASIVYLSRQAFLICFFRDMESGRYDNSLCLGFSALISLLVVISSLLATSFLLLYIQILDVHPNSGWSSHSGTHGSNLALLMEIWKCC